MGQQGGQRHHQRGRKLLFESRQVDFCLLKVLKGYSLELGTHGRDYTLNTRFCFEGRVRQLSVVSSQWSVVSSTGTLQIVYTKSEQWNAPALAGS